MPVSVERLRLDVGLAHAVGDAVLALHTRAGRSLLVGFGPGVDVSTCVFRERLLAGSGGAVSGPRSRVVDVEIGGGLCRASGDLYRRVGSRSEERWFATTLHVDRVAELIDELEPAPGAHAAVLVTLKPDTELAVTVVSVTTETAGDDVVVVAAAERVHRACLVEELLDSVRSSGSSSAADTR